MGIDEAWDNSLVRPIDHLRTLRDGKVGGNASYAVALDEDVSDGVLVEVGDEERFLSSLKKLMADGAMRRRMGEAARRASDRYQVDVVMQQWQELFQGLF